MKSIFSLLLIFLCFEVFSQEKKEIIVKTEVSEATVFINGAQIVRNKTINIVNGKSFIKFVGLSPYIDPKSIQIKANGDVIVLSVNHQFNYIDSVSHTKEIEELNNKAKVLDNKLILETANNEILKEELIFLKDNRNIGGKNQEVSLINLKETENYYKEKISSIKMKEIEINNTIEKILIDKTALDKQRLQITTSKQTPTSEIVVEIDAKSQNKCEFELLYFVNNAGWYPTYDIRVNSIDKPVDLTYKANIQQNTKEEWKNIKLILSSSNPNMGSVAPKLQTYYLNYYSVPPKYTNISNQVSGRILDAKTYEALPYASIIINGTTIGTVSDMDGNFSLSIPNNNSELKISSVGYLTQTVLINNPNITVYLEPSTAKLSEVVVLSKKKSLFESSKNKNDGVVESNKPSATIPVVLNERQTSFEFEIKTPYTINSDNKNITVSIENYALDVNYEYFCVPKIDNDAFLVANIINWEQYNLLEGEANVFFENTFVGKTILDTRYISDTLSISLGRDKNVIVKREKLKEYTTKQFLGNKKEETRAWKISVKNNKNLPINMILFDQVPVSTIEEIEVNIDNISGAVLNKDKGEVKWKFNLEQSGKKDFELKYKVKYPKDRTLTIE